MQVCFGCRTVYHIFVAYFLSITEYKHDQKIILISELIDNSDSIVKNLNRLGLWEKTILIKEASEKQVVKQVRELVLNDLKQIDVFHFFSWGSFSSRMLFNILEERVKIILTEEGIMTYRPFSWYTKWFASLHLSEEEEVKKHFYALKLDRIDEIWLFDPQLYDGSLQRQVKKIELYSLLNDVVWLKKAVTDLNEIFDYAFEENDYEIVFFDMYLTCMKMLTYECEKQFLNDLISILADFKYCIKRHPNEPSHFTAQKYAELTVSFLKEKSLPWEVIYLNLLLHRSLATDKIVLLTCLSTTVFNSLLIDRQIGTQRSCVVLLHELIGNYVVSDIFLESASYIEKFSREYSDLSVLIPKSFAELKTVLNELVKGDVNPKDVQSKEYQAEIEDKLAWMQKQYVANYKYLPETLCWSYLICDYGSGYQWDKPQSVLLDTSKEDFKLCFSLPDAYGDLTLKRIRWIPFQRRGPCIMQFEIFCISKANQKMYLNLNKCHTNGVFTADGIRYHHASPFVEIDLQEKIRELSICGKLLWRDDYNNLISLIMEQEKRQEEQQEQLILNGRLRQYYSLMNLWIKLHQQSGTLKMFFLNKGYLRIAIYGTGEIAKNFLGELSNSEIEVVYFICNSPSAENRFIEKIKVLAIDELATLQKGEKPDVVVVTPVYDWQNIRSNLMKVNNLINVVCLDEVIQFCLKVSELNNEN